MQKPLHEAGAGARKQVFGSEACREGLPSYYFLRWIIIFVFSKQTRIITGSIFQDC
jgi:hypothetical protein